MENKYMNRQSIIKIIHEQIQTDNEIEKEKHNPCKFYPSSVGRCSRSIVYQMLGYPQAEFNGRTLLIFENGTYMHNRIEKILGNTGLLIAPELSFEKPEWRISGRSDAIVYNYLPHEPSKNIIKLTEPIYEKKDGKIIKDKNGNKIKKGEKLLFEGPDNDVMIIELKSISDKGIKYTPKAEHKMQLQLYLHLTGIKVGLLLYENKNNQEMKEFLVPYNPELVKKVTDQIIYVNSYVDKKKLPPREYEKTDFQCRYCGYKDLCWPSKFNYLKSMKKLIFNTDTAMKK